MNVMTAEINPIIPLERLQNANKILFIVHLAIGDYTYLQNCFKAFHEAYPHIKIDLFIDDRRRTSDETKWEALKNYSLYDWIKATPFYNTVYCENYRPDLYEAAINLARTEQYDAVVSLATLSPSHYAALARKIAGDRGFACAMDFEPGLFQLSAKKIRKSLDACIEVKPAERGPEHHVSDEYGHWFKQIGNIELTKKEKYPFIEIPETWKTWASDEMIRLDAVQKRRVFINSFAKNKKRCWPMTHVIELIQKMNEMPEWRDTLFVVNSVPEAFAATKAELDAANIQNVHLFSATENFFQLPAMLGVMDLIISVETAVMHLANAVKVPVIALMRLKTPEWVPIDLKNSIVIFNEKRRHHVADIEPDRVIKALPNLDDLKLAMQEAGEQKNREVEA